MPLSVGDRLGPYQILAPIGAGGTDAVVLNWFEELKQKVPAGKK